MSGPDPLQPISDATSVFRARPEDASFEADFADLAARFATQGGGGLSPELSADLALEIVLNEVVEQACLATGATGAAIALRRGEEMVCRASSGLTAPELGSKLESASGLSGECIKTRRTQRCDDVLADARVDVEASRRLGVRSIMVMPLLRGTELVGVFELFSSLPNAFGERDQRTLEVLVGRILSNLEEAENPLPPPHADKIESQAVASLSNSAQQTEPGAAENSELEYSQPDSEPTKFDFVTAMLGVSVLACAVLLGVLLSRHFDWPRAANHARRTAKPIPADTDSSASSAPAGAPIQEMQKPAPPSSSAGGARDVADDSVPAGSLRVYEKGKEVFRVPPAQTLAGPSAPDSMRRAASLEPEKVVQLSPAAAEGSLLHRVEPDYPEAARQQRVQGAVVLQVHIGGDGAVQDVQVVSGPPLLAQASTDAVKQWRFKPRMVSGHAVEMQTMVTLNFRLPQ